MIYPACSATILQTFKCTLIDEMWVLDADLRLACFTDEWLFYAIIASVGVLLFPIGIAVFFQVVLFLYRDMMHINTTDAEDKVEQTEARYESLKETIEIGSGSSKLVSKLASELNAAKKEMKDAQVNSSCRVLLPV